MTRSPSSHDHTGLAGWTFADGCAVPFDELGPGPRAALVNGARTQALLARWGWPLYPAEPASQTAARLMWDLMLLNDLIVRYELLGGPAADRRLTALGHDWSATLDYLEELLARETETLDSRAQTADEYIAAVAAAATPIAPDTRLDYAALKARIDIADYVGRYTRLRPLANGRLVGRCPLPGHNDSTPSFWVYPESRSWFCFGCNSGGDVFDFATRFDTTAQQLAGAADVA